MKKYIFYSIVIISVLIVIFSLSRFYYFENNKIVEYKNGKTYRYYVSNYYVSREKSDNNIVYLDVVMQLRPLFSLNITNRVPENNKIRGLVFYYNSEDNKPESPKLVASSGEPDGRDVLYGLHGDLDINENELNNIMFESDDVEGIRYKIYIKNVKFENIKEVVDLDQYLKNIR